ncbi:MAG TPA: HD-GYP domain-containing protein [Gemmatimonadota bacterium]|nr:HD-GYP domain-containing protein [Gemmatimonadota bacterium]
MTPGDAVTAQATLGRELVQDLVVLLRAAQLYDPGNTALETAAEKLTAGLRELRRIEGAARLEVGGDLILVNGERIRSELRSRAIHEHLRRIALERGVGGFEWHADPDTSTVARLARIVGRQDGPSGVEGLAAALDEAGVAEVEVLPPFEETVGGETDEGSRERAERTYRHSVAVVRNTMESVRAGGVLQRYRVRRAVQSIVDQVLRDELLLIGLTCLRDYDEPTFTHSVNVCIFSVSLGQRIGLSRLELYDLGLAALLHDIGKVDVPHEVLNKAGNLTEEEWRLMRRHTAFGPWRLLAERPSGSIPVHEMLVAFEHHLNLDLSGYPTLIAPRRLSFYSKIVEIADAFDAGTTPRVYKTDPITPAEMVRILEKGAGTRFDPVLVKAFIGLLGIYPVGCVCLLDTGEIAVVVAPDTDIRNVERPRVRLVVGADGERFDGPVVSLAERQEDGTFPRSVARVVDPERYGIDPARHFVLNP